MAIARPERLLRTSVCSAPPGSIGSRGRASQSEENCILQFCRTPDHLVRSGRITTHYSAAELESLIAAAAGVYDEKSHKSPTTAGSRPFFLTKSVGRERTLLCCRFPDGRVVPRGRANSSRHANCPPSDHCGPDHRTAPPK